MYLSEFLLFPGEKKGKEEGKEGGKEEGREGRRFNNTIETCQSSQLNYVNSYCVPEVFLFETYEL